MGRNRHSHVKYSELLPTEHRRSDALMHLWDRAMQLMGNYRIRVIRTILDILEVTFFLTQNKSLQAINRHSCSFLNYIYPCNFGQ